MTKPNNTESEFNIYDALNTADYDDEMSEEENILNLTDIIKEELSQNISIKEIDLYPDDNAEPELESWQLIALFDALRLQRNNVVFLDISDQLALDELSTALSLKKLLQQTTTIQSFSLYRNSQQLEEDATKVISEGLADNKSIRYLSLGGMKFGDIDDVENVDLILKAVARNTSIIEARIPYDIKKHNSSIVDIITNNHTLVSLYSEYIIARKKIDEHTRHKEPVTLLIEDLKPIFDALKINNTLSHFFATEDIAILVPKSVVDALVEMLETNRTLTLLPNFVLTAHVQILPTEEILYTFTSRSSFLECVLLPEEDREGITSVRFDAISKSNDPLIKQKIQQFTSKNTELGFIDKLERNQKNIKSVVNLLKSLTLETPFEIKSDIGKDFGIFGALKAYYSGKIGKNIFNEEFKVSHIPYSYTSYKDRHHDIESVYHTSIDINDETHYLRRNASNDESRQKEAVGRFKTIDLYLSQHFLHFKGICKNLSIAHEIKGSDEEKLTICESIWGHIAAYVVYNETEVYAPLQLVGDINMAVEEI